MPLHLSRDPDGYYLSGTFGTLAVNSSEPLSEHAVTRYLRVFDAPDEALTVDLPAGDPLAYLGR